MFDIECLMTRNKIVKMFQNFTPDKVDVTRVELQEHLLKCEGCRTFLKEQYEKMRKENVK